MLRATLLVVGICALGACSSTPTQPEGAPAWLDDPADGLDTDRVLLGVASAEGDGPQAAEAARRAALAAIAEQLVASIRSDTTTLETEQAVETLAEGQLEQRAVATDRRERAIQLTTEAEIVGASFELATTTREGRLRTVARAVVDRKQLAEHYARACEDAIIAAERRLQDARGLIEPRAQAGVATSRAIAAVIAADRALVSCRNVMPTLQAILQDDVPELLRVVSRSIDATMQVSAGRAEIAARLSVRLEGGPVLVPLAGHPPALDLRVTWNGEPLADLVMAVQFGDGQASSGVTDAEGRLRIVASVPASDAHGDGRLRAGPAVDGQLGPITAVLPLSWRSPAASRVHVVTHHEVQHGTQASDAISPFRAPVEESLGTMRFAVVDGSSPFDYVLLLQTTTALSSAEGGTSGPYWYRTEVEARLTSAETGESLSVTVPAERTAAAGATTDQAVDRSTTLALALLLDAEQPDSLVSALRSRFR